MIDAFFVTEKIEPTIVMDTENVEIIKAMVQDRARHRHRAVSGDRAGSARAGSSSARAIEGHELVRETGWV